MPVCTSCHQTKQDEAFFHKNKKWKTCQSCIEQRALKKQKTKRKCEDEAVEEEPLRVSLRTVGLMDLAALVSAEMRALINNPPPTAPDGTQICSLDLRVALNLANTISGNEHPKDIARWIVEEIERADEYNWTYNCMNTSMRHKDVAKFYYVCSQSVVAMKEYKEGSNRKRMERFPCQGKMQMKIDMPAAEAMLEIHHGLLHNRPVSNSDISDECRKEIEENTHLNPIQLRQLLRSKGIMKNYTPRQIHSYWERFAINKHPELVRQFSVIPVNTPSIPGITTNTPTQDRNPNTPYSILPTLPYGTTGLSASIVNNPLPNSLQKGVVDQIPKLSNHSFNHDEFVEYVTKMEQFAKRVRNQLDRRNYLWLDTVKILTAGVIEMENDIVELERQRASERATKPWTIHYK
ncbi:4459_t:CDS:2 [Funneliformis caledonium]|uniref:4459_t:CDS:1 n=1 Tax=Funneliformis caledonium TaxID=1117310 RepID=A0A9N9FGP5_9GLOM|nr:4459_t:CDS:2 [Funneliformis caledonium]